jgi:hypothetical protein
MRKVPGANELGASQQLQHLLSLGVTRDAGLSARKGSRLL